MKKIIYSLILLWPASVWAVSLENPLQASSIPLLIGNVIKGILGVVGALALFFLVWGGMMWMTSTGNSQRIQKGKETIVWAIMGLVAIFVSYAVLRLVLSTLGAN